MLCHTWNLRMIVHISPKLSRGLPSTMSCEPMFSRWTLWSRRNCKALSTFSRQWIRILPFVGRGCRRQEHNYTTQPMYTHTKSNLRQSHISQSQHISVFLKPANVILYKNRYHCNHMTLSKVWATVDIYLWEQWPEKLCSTSMLEKNTHWCLPCSVLLTSNCELQYSCSINNKINLCTKSTWHMNSTRLTDTAGTHNKKHMTNWTT